MIEIHRLHLADISPAAHLPWTRPTFPVLAYLVLHPAGPILIDSGVGVGNPHIDELYSPLHRDLDEELGVYGIGVDHNCVRHGPTRTNNVSSNPTAVGSPMRSGSSSTRAVP